MSPNDAELVQTGMKHIHGQDKVEIGPIYKYLRSLGMNDSAAELRANAIFQTMVHADDNGVMAPKLFAKMSKDTNAEFSRRSVSSNAKHIHNQKHTRAHNNNQLKMESFMPPSIDENEPFDSSNSEDFDHENENDNENDNVDSNSDNNTSNPNLTVDNGKEQKNKHKNKQKSKNKNESKSKSKSKQKSKSRWNSKKTNGESERGGDALEMMSVQSESNPGMNQVAKLDIAQNIDALMNAENPDNYNNDTPKSKCCNIL